MANRSHSSSATASSRAAEAVVDPPAHQQPADHQHEQLHRGVGEVRPAAAERYGDAADRHGAEPVGDAALGVLGDRGHGRLDAEHHREREHAGQQVVQVVPAARHLDRAAEQVAEDEQQHQRERDPEDRRPRLADPVLQVAQGHDPALAQGGDHRVPPVLSTAVVGRSGAGRPRRASAGAGARRRPRCPARVDGPDGVQQRSGPAGGTRLDGHLARLRVRGAAQQVGEGAGVAVDLGR